MKLPLAAIGLASVLGLSPQMATAADFHISFKWCSGSPETQLANVPKGTATLEFGMVDLMAQGYRHGGGKIKYNGQKKIPCGGLSSNTYEGPSPPPPQIHEYVWTVKALDASGAVLATAKASRKFPER